MLSNIVKNENSLIIDNMSIILLTPNISLSNISD